MRLVDVVIRQGHLSEQALVEAIMTGDRPAHLDRCDSCSSRAVELNRWLESVRTVAIDAAEDVFTPERLAVQRAQIQRRLEQLDEPARVIAFPGQARADLRDSGRRRVAAGWLGVAAAAGLVLGVIGGHASARIGDVPTVVIQVPTVAPTTETTAGVPTNAWLDLDDDTRTTPEPLGAYDLGTPRLALAVALQR
jgi:hypothetical protein